MNLKEMFKKTTYVSIKDSRNVREMQSKPEVPKGLLKKCNVCKAAIIAEDVKNGYYICPKCHSYFRMHAYRRIVTRRFDNFSRTVAAAAGGLGSLPVSLPIIRQAF